MPKIVPKSIQTCFERVLGQTFRKFFAQFPTAFRILEKFQKNQKKISKFQKRPKSFPKEPKRVLIVIWDNFFGKFLPSFRWNVESSKIFKFFFSKFQKCPKVFPKESKRVLGLFFRKNLMPSVPWRVESSKIFKKIKKLSKFQKCPKSFPKVCKHVLNMLLEQTFRKIFAQFSMECRVYENFQKKIFSKFQKWPKVFPKVSKRVLG